MMPQQQFSQQPQQVPEFLVMAIVSKFSQACHKLLPTLQFLSANAGLKIVQIDNPKIRDIVIKGGKIKSVPAILLLFPSQNKVQYYEGQECVQLINKIVADVQQQLVAQAQMQAQMQKKKEGKTKISEIEDVETQDEPEEIDNTRATMGDRNMRNNMPRKGAGHKDMALSTLPDGPRAAPTTRMNEPLVTQNPRQAKAPVDAPNDVEILDDFDYSTGDGEEMVPKGLSREDILGPQGASVGRETAQKSSNLHKRASEMAKERGIE